MRTKEQSSNPKWVCDRSGDRDEGRNKAESVGGAYALCLTKYSHFN